MSACEWRYSSCVVLSPGSVVWRRAPKKIIPIWRQVEQTRIQTPLEYIGKKPHQIANEMDYQTPLEDAETGNRGGYGGASFVVSGVGVVEGGGKQEGRVHVCWRVSLFVLAALMIVFSPLIVMMALVDSLSLSEGSGQGHPQHYEFAAWVAIPIGLASGLITCLATVHAHYRSVLAWTIAIWAFMALFLLELILSIFVCRGRVVGITIWIGLLCIFQLITCIVFTPLNTVRKMKPLKTCCQ